MRNKTHPDGHFNPYAVLGVSRNATAVEITRARNRLVKKYRAALGVSPCPEQTEQLRAVIKAYEILSNPETRRAYDQSCYKRVGSAIWKDALLDDVFATAPAPAWNDIFGPARRPTYWNRPSATPTTSKQDNDNLLYRIFGI